MANRNSDRERYKYGMCLNDECSKCKSKEIQQLSVRKDFVCSECGQELRECPPPKKNKNKFVIVMIAAVLVAACGITLPIMLSGNVEDAVPVNSEPVAVEPVVTDSVTTVNDVVEVVTTEDDKDSTPVKQVTAPTGSINYGKWSGSWKNGKPHGTGTMTYTKEHLVDKRDPQKRTASKGDYIIGEFANGKLVQGVWYDSNNNVKGSIIIGM